MSLESIRNDLIQATVGTQDGTQLAPVGTPRINGAQVRRKLSNVAMKNTFQGVIEKLGYGINDTVGITDESTADATQITVVRILPQNVNTRRLGAMHNGGWFNSKNGDFTKTKSYQIDLLDVMDTVIPLGNYQMDLIPVKLITREPNLVTPLT